MVMAVESGEYVVHLPATKNRTPDSTHRASWINPQPKAARLQGSTTSAPGPLPALLASLRAEVSGVIVPLADYDLDTVRVRVVKRLIRGDETPTAVLTLRPEHDPRDLVFKPSADRSRLSFE